MKYSHETWMKRASLLAEKGRGLTSPNPIVGACLVKNEKIISEGFHRKYGAAHAEIEALKKAGNRAEDATLYVTLEPCSTWGKTPPCVQAIIRSGVKEVVVGLLDPNPLHHGKGIQILRKAGIKVKVGVLWEESEHQTREFRKWIVEKRPYVILKMAQSLDGKIATRTGDSKWISGKAARKFAHCLRSKVDAVLVGKNTALRDNPDLTARSLARLGDGPRRELSPHSRQPWRIVLDAKLEIPKTANVFNGKSTTVLVCAEKYLKKVVSRGLSPVGAITILPVTGDRRYKLNLNMLLDKLGKLGIVSILVEGGGELAASFLEQKLVDQIYFVVAPKIIGGRDAKTSVEGEGISRIKFAVPIRNRKIVPVGEDIVISGDVA